MKMYASRMNTKGKVEAEHSSMSLVEAGSGDFGDSLICRESFLGEPWNGVQAHCSLDTSRDPVK
jgi:hypothetical protein